jgi:lysophospholipase L1-like esterase
LERELNDLLRATARSSADAASPPDATAVAVRWRGLPGWTASAMADCLGDPTSGLRSAIGGVRDPPLSLVLILAGTNDIGAHTSSDDDVAGAIRAVVDPIIRLHRACHHEVGGGGVRTVAVGVPGSAWQEANDRARRLRDGVNEELRRFASSDGGGGRVKYVDFPFPFSRGGRGRAGRDGDGDGDGECCSELWNDDGLHLSEGGYEALGRRLAPFVFEILDGTSFRMDDGGPR